MEQAIETYRRVSAANEFKELERLRSLARHNEASALAHARRVEREKWQGVLADKDAALADKDAALAEQAAALAQQAALIAELRAKMGEDNG